LRGEGPDQVQIIFIAREKIRIIERGVEVRWRGNDQRDLAVSDLPEVIFPRSPKKTRILEGPLELSLFGLMAQRPYFELVHDSEAVSIYDDSR